MSPNNNRVPPHDAELEAQVLGAAVFFPADNLPTLLDSCKPEDFYVPAHQGFMRTLSQLHTQRRSIDPVNVRAALAAHQDVFDALTPSFTTDIGALCDRLALLAINRRNIATAFKLADDGLKSGKDPHPFFAASQRMVSEMVSDGRARSEVEDAAELSNEAYRSLQSPNAQATFVRTGIPDLDRRLGGGLEAGRLYVAAGRPGMGKSAFMFQVLLNAAKSGQRALGFTLEMKSSQLQTRLVAHESGIDSRSLRAAMGDMRSSRIAGACDRLSKLPYALVDDPDITIQQIRIAARRERARRGLSLVVVDYLQLMASDGRHDNREQEVAAISRGLKKLGGELDVAVLVGSQLNRGVEGRADKRPLLSDLRESGAIEQDADGVLLMYRDDYYNENSPDRGLCDIGLAKWRDGDTGVVRTLFERETSTFKSLATKQGGA